MESRLAVGFQLEHQPKFRRDWLIIHFDHVDCRGTETQPAPARLDLDRNREGSISAYSEAVNKLLISQVHLAVGNHRMNPDPSFWLTALSLRGKRKPALLGHTLRIGL